MTRAAATLARVSAGIVVWAAHFGILYGSTALACARGSVALGAGVAVGSTFAAVAIAAALCVREWRRRDRFDSWLAATIAALALVAIVFEGMTLLAVPRCR